MLPRHLFSLLDRVLLGEVFATDRFRELLTDSSADFFANGLEKNQPAIAQLMEQEKDINNPHGKHLEVLLNLYFFKTMDKTRAQQELLELVEKGVPEALTSIIRLQDDLDESLALCGKYYNSEDKAVRAVACFHIGWFALNGKGPSRLQLAMTYYEIARKLNYTPAILALGGIFYKGYSDSVGEHVAVDVIKAREYFMEAASLGDGVGSHHLALSYSSAGIQDKETLSQIKELFEEAFFYGHSKSALKLGEIYEESTSCFWSNRLAIYYYQEAFDMGMPEGAFHLGLLADEGQEEDSDKVSIERDPAAAHQYFAIAAQGKIPHAFYRLGYHWQVGDGVPYPDVHQAIRCYEEGRKLGDFSCTTALAGIYLKGHKDKIDPDCALSLQLYLECKHLGADDVDDEINFLKSMVKIESLLQVLKIKTDELINKGDSEHDEYDVNYLDVADAANQLMCNLRKAKQDFLRGKISAFIFKGTFNHAMSKAESTFKQHRGWHSIEPIFRALIGIIATITVLPAIYVSLCTKNGYLGTFYGIVESDSARCLRVFREQSMPEVERLEEIPAP
jgi:TPR repeat protein